jgi:hypothetical protein
MSNSRIQRCETRCGASDNSKLSGFERFGPSYKVSDWTADRLTEGPCYALIRMRTLSVSNTEGCLVISCKKVEYDKSSYCNN